MKKQEKILAVQNLTEKLKEAKSVVMTNYRGLTVGQMGQLRSLIKKAGGEVLVIKNTLLARAFKEAQLSTDERPLTEPTAIVLAYQDELAPLKTIADFAKSSGLPTLKSGFWENRMVTKDELEQLSRLPNKNELPMKLLQLLQTPQARFLSLLSTNQAKLLFLLKNWGGGEKING